MFQEIRFLSVFKMANVALFLSPPARGRRKFSRLPCRVAPHNDRIITDLNTIMLIGIISDAHGHHAAFLKGLEMLREAGAEQIFFLGDAVGYIPRVDVVQELMTTGIQCIQGNHESMLLSDLIREDKDRIYKLANIKTMLTETQYNYLKSWPDSMNFDLDGQKIMLIHGSPTDYVYGYVYPDTDLSAFSNVNADVIFMGNTHHPFIRHAGNKLFVNTGSCGLPRDTTGKGCVCVYDGNSREAELLRYDISASARKLLDDPLIHESVKRHLKRAAGVVS